MNDEHKNTLIDYVVQLGDDSLVLGHRLSEWTSKGPFLEEDIALSNVALDYIGRARMFYTYAAELAGDGKTEDDFAYLRGVREFKNYLLSELPNGDFAYTMARQFMVDAFNSLFLPLLMNSKDDTLAAIATKAEKETRYHLRRSRDWVIKLGDGTQESHERIQSALNDLWGYHLELFEPCPAESSLIEQSIAADISTLKDEWLLLVSNVLDEATLETPQSQWAVRGGRSGYHTEHLGHMLCVMQSVHRSYPGCQW
jgi:ring-1,2-phenylacetyl-CoA epoxidase subunit PaaC